MKKLTIFLLSLTGLFLLPVLTSAQQVLYVNTNASGANDGTSWADAFVYLDDAIAAADSSDAIWIAKGFYTPGGANPHRDSSFVLKNGIALYGGFIGSEAALEDRKIEIFKTYLSGGAMPDVLTNSRHIMLIPSGTTNATILDGLFFIHGKTDELDGVDNDRRGGAILAFGASMIRNCSFSQNNGYLGGAIYLRYSGTSGTHIEDCEFKDNHAASGGAILMIEATDISIQNCTFTNHSPPLFAQGRGGAIQSVSSDFIISDCRFTNNGSTDIRTGGAVNIHHDSSKQSNFIIRNCDFIKNDALFGGGIAAYDEQTNGEIINCFFSENTVRGRGGAFTSGFKSHINLRSCLFQSNEDAPGGGAIFCQNDSTSINVDSCQFIRNYCRDIHSNRGAVLTEANAQMLFNHCSFEENTTGVRGIGGAIAFHADSSNIASLTVKNTRFLSNSSGAWGSAIDIENTNVLIENSSFSSNESNESGVIFNYARSNHSSFLKIVNSTIAGNTGRFGGGLAQAGENSSSHVELVLLNTILFQGQESDYILGAGTTAIPIVTSLGGNLSGDNTLANVLTNTNDLVLSNPMFVNLNTDDLRLSNSSPAVNAGVAAGATTIDIDGNPRLCPDMGAFENVMLDSPDCITGLEVVKDNHALNIFPNPASEQIQVELHNEWRGELIFLLTNLIGQEVLQFQMDKLDFELKQELNIALLPPGVYQLSIQNKEQIIVKQLILQ